MVLAVVADVVVRLGRPLTTLETARAEPGLLEEAEALVLAYLGLDEWPVLLAGEVAPAWVLAYLGLDEWLAPLVGSETAPIPSMVTIVTSRMVARVLDQDAKSARPAGAESVTQTAGPFGETYNFGSGSTSGSPWLTAGDKVVLKRHRVNGGQSSVPMSTGQTGLYRRVVR